MTGRHRPDARPVVWADLVEKTTCTDPAGHYRLERSAAQELRMPPTVDVTGCPWCGKPYQREA